MPSLSSVHWCSLQPWNWSPSVSEGCSPQAAPFRRTGLFHHCPRGLSTACVSQGSLSALSFGISVLARRPCPPSPPFPMFRWPPRIPQSTSPRRPCRGTYLRPCQTLLRKHTTKAENGGFDFLSAALVCRSDKPRYAHGCVVTTVVYLQVNSY